MSGSGQRTTLENDGLNLVRRQCCQSTPAGDNSRTELVPWREGRINCCGPPEGVVRPRESATGNETGMNDVTGILAAIEAGDPHAAEQLLPLVYDELRKLAAQRLANEKPGQTLQATALVHEAYLRLVGGASPQHF